MGYFTLLYFTLIVSSNLNTIADEALETEKYFPNQARATKLNKLKSVENIYIRKLTKRIKALAENDKYYKYKFILCKF